MHTVLFNDNHINRDEILNYKDLIQAIVDGLLRYPKIKKMEGREYQKKPVYRAKIDKKNRLLFTYVLHEGKKTLLVLAINDHNYDKAKRQLSFKNTVSHECIELHEETQAAPTAEDVSKGLALTPSISFNQMTLALDEWQQQGIVLQAPVLFCGPPGSGKTVLLYNMMLRSIKSMIAQDEHEADLYASEKEKEKEKENEQQPPPTLFVSQSAYSLNILKGLYQQTIESNTIPVLFTTWEDLLQSHHPGKTPATPEHFATWLKMTFPNEPANVVHYEFSLIAALGAEKYLGMGNRQCYYSNTPQKQNKIISLLKQWQEHLKNMNWFDPMVTPLPPQTALHPAIFGDEIQNLPPVAIAHLIKQAQDQRFIGSLDTEQCLISSPYIHGCTKKLLFEHYKKYTEHTLPRTWRCPAEVTQVANHLMHEKYRLDGKGKKRAYGDIISAQKTQGLVSWVDTKGLADIHHHGAAPGTVVIAESLSPGERESINTLLGTNNILTASQAIGSDFDVVILWKPISKSSCLLALAKHKSEQHNNLTLEQWNALNALYVSLTRAQRTVFIYEHEARLRSGFGTRLLSKLPLNQTSPFRSEDKPEHNMAKWVELADEYLAKGHWDLAKNIMQYNLLMSNAAIEEKIQALKPIKYVPQYIPEKKQQQTLPKKQQKRKKPPCRKKKQRNRQNKKEQVDATSTACASKPRSLSENTNASSNEPCEIEKKFIASLLEEFTSKKLTVAIKLFTKNSEMFLNCLLYTEACAGGTTTPLLSFIMQDPERSRIFFSCLANQSLKVLHQITLDGLEPFVKEHAPFRDLLLELSNVQKSAQTKWNSEMRPIHVAAATGNVQVLRSLIKLGVDLNQPFNNGATPAYIAAQNGHHQVLYTLHEFGADLNLSMDNGATPAYIAAYNGNVSVLQTLGELGADLNLPKNNGVTPAYIAAQNGHQEVLCTLHQLGADLNQVNSNGATPAYIAAQNGHHGVLRILHQLGVDLNLPEKNGATPAYIAAQNGHVSVLLTLGELGADLNIADINGQTPANIAAYNGNVSVLQTLGELGVDLNKADKNGATPAYIAAYKGHVSVLQTLGELGADLNLPKGNGVTPAYIAAQNGHHEVLCTLHQLGADLNQANYNDATPAFIAAQYAHHEVLRTLHQLGANLNLPEKNGATPAYIAAFNGHASVLQTLGKLGADLNKANNNGQTPGFIATQKGHHEVLRTLHQWGVSLNETNKNGETLAYVAATNGHHKVLHALHQLAVDLNQTTKDGETLAYIVAERGHVSALQTLKESGANLNQANMDGHTPAYIAAKNGHVEILRTLKESGADLSQASITGINPAYAAAYRGHFHVLHTLKQLEVDLNQPDNKGLYPSFIAAQWGHCGVLFALNQFDVDLKQLNNNGLTLAYIATGNKQTSVLHTLKEIGIDLNQRNSSGSTPVHAAAQFGDNEILHTLHELGADLNLPDLKGSTPALIAAYYGHASVLHTLKNLNPDLDLNQANKNGITPAFIAASRGHVSVLHALEGLGTDLNIPTNNGATPAYAAAENGHHEVLRALHQLGANLNQKDRNNTTPAFIAAYNGHVTALQTLEELGADLNVHDNNGATPASAAACKGRLSVLQKLQELGVDLNQPDKNGATAAFLAAQNGHLDVINFLITHDVKINHQFISTREKLIQFCNECAPYALERMKNKIEDHLKCLGSDTDHIPLLPIDIAFIMGHESIVKALEQTPRKKQEPDRVSFFAVRGVSEIEDILPGPTPRF